MRSGSHQSYPFSNLGTTLKGKNLLSQGNSFRVICSWFLFTKIFWFQYIEHKVCLIKIPTQNKFRLLSVINFKNMWLCYAIFSRKNKRIALFSKRFWYCCHNESYVYGFRIYHSVYVYVIKTVFSWVKMSLSGSSIIKTPTKTIRYSIYVTRWSVLHGIYHLKPTARLTCSIDMTDVQSNSFSILRKIIVWKHMPIISHVRHSNVISWISETYHRNTSRFCLRLNWTRNKLARILRL